MDAEEQLPACCRALHLHLLLVFIFVFSEEIMSPVYIQHKHLATSMCAISGDIGARKENRFICQPAYVSLENWNQPQSGSRQGKTWGEGYF